MEKLSIVIFGAGGAGETFYKHNKNKFNCIAFIDNDIKKKGQILCGKSIYTPNELSKLNYDHIVIASDYFLEIYEQLIQKNAIDKQDISLSPHLCAEISQLPFIIPPASEISMKKLSSNSEENLQLIMACLIDIASRFARDYEKNQHQLTRNLICFEKELTQLKNSEFEERWLQLTNTICTSIELSSLLFDNDEFNLSSSILKFQNKRWLSSSANNIEYQEWLQFIESGEQRDLLLWPLLLELAYKKLDAKQNGTLLTKIYFFKDLLYSFFVNDEYQELQLEIFSICYQQKKNWKFCYGNSYPYQGFSRIGISGLKPTEERLSRYNIRKYLTVNDDILDIGSNFGFLSMEISKYVRTVDMVEYNPYLIAIADKTKAVLQISNITSHVADFVNLQSRKLYNAIFSLANHCTIDGNLTINFEEYIGKCFNMLKKDGYLFFESHNIFSFGEHCLGNDSDLNEKFDIIEQYFSIEESKLTGSYVPIGDVDKVFVVLKRRDKHEPTAERTFQLEKFTSLSINHKGVI